MGAVFNLPLTSWSEEHIRSIALITLITGNGVLVLSSRQLKPRARPGINRSAINANESSERLWPTANWTAPVFVTLAMVLLALSIHWPWLAEPMQLAPLSGLPWSMALIWGILSWPLMLALAKCSRPSSIT
jgi:hypothetical protein